MRINYFGQGLRAKLGELRKKVAALAEEAGLSEKTIQRIMNGEEVSESTKQAISGPLGMTIEAIERLGRSRILSRTWVASDLVRKDAYELTEVLDADYLFQALGGATVRGYFLTYPTLEAGGGESAIGAVDFQRLAKLHEFLLSLMLLAPVDPMYAARMDPADWDNRLRDLQKLGYTLLVGASDVGRRIVSLNQADDLQLVQTEEGPRRYTLDLRDPYQDEIESPTDVEVQEASSDSAGFDGRQLVLPTWESVYAVDALLSEDPKGIVTLISSLF
jgi:transcriptional regulator with XRE-family HTH domain